MPRGSFRTTSRYLGWRLESGDHGLLVCHALALLGRAPALFSRAAARYRKCRCDDFRIVLQTRRTRALLSFSRMAVSANRPTALALLGGMPVYITSAEAFVQTCKLPILTLCARDAHASYMVDPFWAHPIRVAG